MRVLLVLVLALGALTAPLAAQPPAVVTLDKLTELLSLDVAEAKLLKLVADSPAVFVLGQAEEAALRKAGATDALIDAIKAKAKATPLAGDIRAFVVILDVSGSMADKDTAGVAKWGPAQEAAIKLVAAVPEERLLAFIVYGHDAKKECEAVEVVVPLSPATAKLKGQLKEYILKLKPTGHTPIAASLKLAGGELKKADGLSKVILITDGMETCHGDPNKEAAELAKIDTFRGVDVVGLGLNAVESKAVGGIASAGKGKYHDAKTTADLTRSVAAIAAAIKKPDPEPKADEVTAVEKAMIKQLKDDDASVRKAAAESLQKRGNKAKEIVDALAERVADDVWSYTSPSGTSVDNAAGNTSKDAALAAVVALAPDRAEGTLVAAGKSKNERVRTWAADALGRRTTDRPGGDQAIPAGAKTLIALLSDEDPYVRYAAAKALENRKDKAKEIVDALAARVADDLWTGSTSRGTSPDNATGNTSKDAALKALKALDPKRVEEALVKAMDSKTKKVKEWATKAVEKLGK